MIARDSQLFRRTAFAVAVGVFAQIVLCLIAAPVVAAQQWVSSPTSDERSPTENRPLIRAFDASNIRSEENSESNEKRGKNKGSDRRVRFSGPVAQDPQIVEHVGNDRVSTGDPSITAPDNASAKADPTGYVAPTCLLCSRFDFVLNVNDRVSIAPVVITLKQSHLPSTPSTGPPSV